MERLNNSSSFKLRHSFIPVLTQMRKKALTFSQGYSKQKMATPELSLNFSGMRIVHVQSFRCPRYPLVMNKEMGQS